MTTIEDEEVPVAKKSGHVPWLPKAEDDTILTYRLRLKQQMCPGNEERAAAERAAKEAAAKAESVSKRVDLVEEAASKMYKNREEVYFNRLVKEDCDQAEIDQNRNTTFAEMCIVQ